MERPSLGRLWWLFFRMPPRYGGREEYFEELDLGWRYAALFVPELLVLLGIAILTLRRLGLHKGDGGSILAFFLILALHVPGSLACALCARAIHRRRDAAGRQG